MQYLQNYNCREIEFCGYELKEREKKSFMDKSLLRKFDKSDTRLGFKFKIEFKSWVGGEASYMVFRVHC